MASIDVIFSFAEVENIRRMKVARGQAFDLLLNLEDEQSLQVENAATGDQILDIKPSGSTELVHVTAKEIGVSRFAFIKKAEVGFEVIKEVRIEVVESIIPTAKTIGASGSAVDKQ